MGWFDQETKEGDNPPVTGPATQQRPEPPSPAASARRTSTIGQRVQINGTVVSEEDLKIVGKVEGTIHTRKALRVAREAEVKAVINGTAVLVEGTVNGDINATETLILGATAMLTGNIKTPSLQIHEGAFFRGQVTMQQPQKDSVKPKADEDGASKRQAPPPSASANRSSARDRSAGDASRKSTPAASANRSSARDRSGGDASRESTPAAKPAEGVVKPADAPGA